MGNGISDVFYHNAYLNAAKSGNFIEIESYITSYPNANINYTDIDGYSALLLASKYGHLGMRY